MMQNSIYCCGSLNTVFSFPLLVSPGQAAEPFQDWAQAAGGWHAAQSVSCPGHFLRRQWTCRETQINKVNCSRNTAQGNNNWTIFNSLKSPVKCVLSNFFLVKVFYKLGILKFLSVQQGLSTHIFTVSYLWYVVVTYSFFSFWLRCLS